VLFGRPDVTIVVVDSTRLERNLNLVLQILDITDRVVVFLNLVDEARRHGVAIDASKLEAQLGVPVVEGVARESRGIDELLDVAHQVATGQRVTRPLRIEGYPPDVEQAVASLTAAVNGAFPGLPNARWVAQRLLRADEAVTEAVRSGELGHLGEGPAAGPPGHPEGAGASRHAILEAARRLRWDLPSSLQDTFAERTFAVAHRIADEALTRGLEKSRFDLDRTLDGLLTSRTFGFPIMLAILAVVFWLTIQGANVPSGWLAALLIDRGHG